MGPVVKLYIYKATLALNDNKSVSITWVVAQWLVVCSPADPTIDGEDATQLIPSSWLQEVCSYWG